MKHYINVEAAPKEWVKFKKWHALACDTDSLSAEDRFKQMGYTIPKEEKKKDEPR